MIAIAFIMIPINYYLFNFGWYDFLAFPAGCLLATHYEKFIIIYKKNRSTFIILSIAGIIYALIYKLLMSHESINSIVINVIPNILLAYVSEGNGLIISFSCLILIGQSVERGINSNILLFLGKYSYEIFLLHGVFLIKYNPVITGQNAILTVIQFLLFFSFVTVLSILTHKIHHTFYAIKT